MEELVNLVRSCWRWLSDLVDFLISLDIASRAFAFYYLLQSINAWFTAGKCHCGWRCCLERVRFGFFIAILTFVVIFGHSAE